MTQSLTRLIFGLLLGASLLASPPSAWAQGAPLWSRLKPDQQRFLLEAFNLPEGQRANFADPVPNEAKQILLDSMWGLLTPEKRVQVLLYAHIEKPFGAASNQTAVAPAPPWPSLSKLQRARLYEALHWDGMQRSLWEGMPAELRQAAFEALWAYLPPDVRRAVLSK